MNFSYRQNMGIPKEHCIFASSKSDTKYVEDILLLITPDKRSAVWGKPTLSNKLTNEEHT